MNWPSGIELKHLRLIVSLSMVTETEVIVRLHKVTLTLLFEPFKKPMALVLAVSEVFVYKLPWFKSTRYKAAAIKKTLS